MKYLKIKKSTYCNYFSKSIYFLHLLFQEYLQNCIYFFTMLSIKLNWPKQQYNKLKRRKIHFLLGSFYGIYNRKAFWKVKIIFMNCFYFLFFMNNGKFLNYYIFHFSRRFNFQNLCRLFFAATKQK